MADAQYFGGRDDVGTRLKRPKLPFAPLSIAGRGAFTGTVLFYGPDPQKKVVEPMSTLEMTLTVVMPSREGWLDRLLSGRAPPPVTIKAEVPNFLPGQLYSGENAPLKVSSGGL